jgi:hypothetical protein
MHKVINKPNLDVILHSYLGYMDFSWIHISPNYLSRLRKDVFAIICQLAPVTFLLNSLLLKVNGLLCYNVFITLIVKKLDAM